MKATIRKSEKATSYALLNSNIKANQWSNLVNIYTKLVKILRLKVRPINIFGNDCLGISIAKRILQS